MENRSIAGLDLIRFAAAAFVALFHLGYYQWLSGNIASFPRLAPLASAGWVGVEIFFVLSGFVISYSADGKSPGAFARSRFLRLYPGVWICATIALVVGAGDADAYLRSMTLWPFSPYVDGVYWTLGVEMAFYGLVFLTLLGARRERLAGLLAAIGGISSAFWFLWLADHLMGGKTLDWTMGHRYFELLLIHYGCFFALGGTVWLISFSEPGFLKWPTATTSFLSGLICIYSIAEAKSSSGEGFGPAVPLLLWGLAVVGIILSVRYSRWLGWLPGKATRTLGLATYPLYLLHHAVGTPLMKALLTWHVDAATALFVGLAAVMALSIAVLTPEAFVRDRAARTWDWLATSGNGRPWSRL